MGLSEMQGFCAGNFVGGGVRQWAGGTCGNNLHVWAELQSNLIGTRSNEQHRVFSSESGALIIRRGSGIYFFN